MESKHTSAYKQLVNDPKFKQFISNKLKFARWKNKQSRFNILTQNKHVPRSKLVISTGNSNFITII